MTTVTITIDDPNGLDSNLLFPSAFPYDSYGAGTFSTTEGDVRFQRLANGVAVEPNYWVTVTGNDLVLVVDSLDVRGDITSMKLNPVGNNGVPGGQLVHADFALDGLWLSDFGGVRIESLIGLTVDVLMGRIMQKTSANLVLIGNIGNDILNGSFLDDTLRGGAGADVLRGGEGNDTASYEGSALGVTINLSANTASGGDAAGDRFYSIENIIGTNLGDNITGNSAANFIDGGFGFDTIDGGAGDDFIFGRDGGGTLRGGSGNDRVDGGAEDDTLYGGTGNDELRVGFGTNTAYGEDGNDTLLGASGIDRLYGGAGIDTLNGVSGDDLLDGGAGADIMSGGTGASRYYVDDAGDSVLDFGVNDGDRVYTRISYTLGASSLIERFSTTSVAGTGAINLTGNEFAQAIYGNAGANVINGKGGADTMQGYGGNDKYYVDDANDVVIEAAGGGTADQIVAYVDYTLAANVEIATTNFAAGTAAIDLTGNSLANDIRGNAGSNILNGKGGSDTLRGYGGSDTFVFDSPLGSSNIDTVADFSVADDTIRLNKAIFTAIAGTGVLTLAQFAANASGTAQDATDRIIYETDTGKLFYDSNGSAAGGSIQFAALSPGLALTNADFFIV